MSTDPREDAIEPAIINEDLHISCPLEMKLPAGIRDSSFHEAASHLRSTMVPVEPSISPSEAVEVTYMYWSPVKNETATDSTKLPVILLHGFDGSSFEFRRLGPLLSGAGHPTYAVDALGWGCADISNVTDFSAKSKLEVLMEFWETIGANGDVCIVGSSLGASLAVEFTNRHQQKSGVTEARGDHKNIVKAVILISGHVVLVDGDFMKCLPISWIKFCVWLLGNPFLRQFVDNLSRVDNGDDDVKDSMKVWKARRNREGWEDAQISYMKSGGYSTSAKVPVLNKVPTLMIWGTGDRIAGSFGFPWIMKHIVPNSQTHPVENCGHFPHLEKPEETAREIEAFLESKTHEDM